MVAIKRSLSSSPTPSDASPTPSSGPSSSPAVSSANKSKTSPKAAGKKKSKGRDDGSPTKRVRVNWTAEEDIIILDLLKDIAKDQLWSKIKEDGRLVHRGSQGIKVHFDAMMKKIVSAQGQGGRS